MKVNIHIEGVPDDVGRGLTAFIQFQVKLTRDVLIPSVVAIQRAAAGITAAISALMLPEGEEAEEDEHVCYPFGGSQLNMVSCESCGWLTCRCEVIEEELYGMADT